MGTPIDFSRAYLPSGDVVVRRLQRELVLLPLAAGIGDASGELFTLNATGEAVWDRLDGVRTLADVVDELSAEYDAAREEIERGVRDLVGELLARRMVVAV